LDNLCSMSCYGVGKGIIEMRPRIVVILIFLIAHIGCSGAGELRYLTAPNTRSLTQAIIVTEDDIQICAPKRIDGKVVMNWRKPSEVISVGYSTEPLNEHTWIALPTQTWEGLLNKERPELGKAIMQIRVPAPKKGTIMCFRFRTRFSDNSKISRWSKLFPVIVFPN